MKNQSPLVPTCNKAEFRKVDVPVSGEDSVESKKTDDGNSMKINPFRKVKGNGLNVIYSVTNISMIHD